MKKNKIFAMMAAAMTFAACSTSDITSDYSFDDDKNTVTVSSVTRAGENQTTTTPTTVDMHEPFLLTNLTQKKKAGYNYEAVFEYDSNNNSWEPSEKVMWYGSGLNEFQATYPYVIKNGFEQYSNDFDKFKIPGYQKEDSDSIPDWMRATIKATRTIENGTVKPLAINLQHMLSKVTVVCDYSGSPAPTIDGKTITGASVNKIFTRVQYCKAVKGEDGKVTIQSYENSAYGTEGLYVWTTNTPDDANKKASSTAIVAPGAYTNIGKIFIYYNGGNEEVVVSIPDGINLEAGKHYTFTLKSDIAHKQATISSVSVEPWIAGDEITTTPAEKYPYVTFSALSEQEFTMTIGSNRFSAKPINASNRAQTTNTRSTSTDDLDLSKFEYSINEGEWQQIPQAGMTTGVKFGGSNGTLRLRGKSPNGTTSNDKRKCAKISFSEYDVDVSCTGDIRTLIDYENYQNVDTQNARFMCLFRECTSLTTAPNLPAISLADYCYYGMFYECHKLEKAPELPATTLADYCYGGMFLNCVRLKNAPELPATTLAEYCYSNMFSNCISLISAPVLSANTLKKYCYSGMFLYCTSLTTAPTLPAMTLAEACYASMFQNCSNLTTSPILSAAKLEQDCYNQMFTGCNSLSSVTMLATDVNATDCLSAWLEDAGKDAQTRTLKLNGKEAYEAIKSTNLSTGTLPDIWQAGANNTKILDKDGKDITSTISSTNP